jgi:hypothetical protein
MLHLRARDATLSSREPWPSCGPLLKRLAIGVNSSLGVCIRVVVSRSSKDYLSDLFRLRRSLIQESFTFGLGNCAIPRDPRKNRGIFW